MKKLVLALLALFATPAPAAVAIQVSPDVLAALQLCPVDSLYHFKTSACPVPGWVSSPSLDGLPAVTSPFDVSESLQPSWGSGAIPVSSKPDNLGAFRFICRDSGTNNDDVIVFPGQPGKSHLHQYYCHGADAFTTYASIRTGAEPFNGKAIKCVNCSGYWMPAMLDGTGKVVGPDAVEIYYKRRPASDPKCSLTSGDPKAEGNCLPIPNGLKFIFGYDMLTGKSPTGGNRFYCMRGWTPDGGHPSITEAAIGCPVGAHIIADLMAPSCWDGKNLDSPNHRDHVGYPGYGTWGYLRCPLDHPYVIPRFEIKAMWPIRTGDDPSKWCLSSDAMRPGLACGTTFHADYFEAWDPTVKAMWTDGCINKMLNCSGGDLGNGLQLKGAQ
jgi:hypothetical protein